MFDAMLHISNNLKGIRLLLGKTQLELAEILDVKDKKGNYSKDKIYNYEAGKAFPPMPIIEKLSNLIGVDIEELSKRTIPYKELFSLYDESLKEKKIARYEENQLATQTSEEQVPWLKSEISNGSIDKLIENNTMLASAHNKQAEANRQQAEANRQQAEANRLLVESNMKLIERLNITADASQQIPLTVQSRFDDLLVLLAEMASGKQHFHSYEEAFAFVNSKFYKPQKKKENKDLPAGKGT